MAQKETSWVALLRGQKGWGKGEVIELELKEGMNLIGRSNEDLRIVNEKVSRRHCTIRFEKKTGSLRLFRISQSPTELISPKGESLIPPVSETDDGIELEHGHQIVLSGVLTLGVELEQDATCLPETQFSQMATVDEDTEFARPQPKIKPKPQTKPQTQPQTKPQQTKPPQQKKRKREPTDNPNPPSPPAPPPPSAVDMSVCSPFPSQVDIDMCASWEGGGAPGGGGEEKKEKHELDGLSSAKPDEYNIEKMIGKGACGEVFLATVRGKKVAVKRVFRSLLSQDAFADFIREAEVLEGLSHPNVVKFVNYITDATGNMCLVFEYINRGSVYDALRDKDIAWTSRLKLRVIEHSARGIAYLHSKKLIHRDLKCQNLLMTEDFVVKVTDFGLARPLERDQTTAKTVCGTMPWIAPEVLLGGGYKFKADVYSYAMCVYEVLSRKEPYKGMNEAQIICAVINDNKRPDFSPPQDRPTALIVDVMQKCWAKDPNVRPSSAEVVRILEIGTAALSEKK